MNVLFYFDEEKFNWKSSLYSGVIPDMQNIVSAYNGLGLAALTNDDLKDLLFNTETLVFNKMTGGQPLSIAGLTVDVHKAMELIAKPIGYAVLIQKVSYLLDAVKQQNVFPYIELRMGVYELGNNYELDNTGAIILKASFLASLTNSYNSYLTTDKASNVNDFAQAIITSYNTLGMSNILNNPNGIGRAIEELFEPETRQNRGTLILSRSGILKYNN